jgi:ferrous iron transport protein A
VLAVDGDDALARRLGDLGLWPGTEVEVLTRAPFGDPILFRLRGYRLALRREEARRVRTMLPEPL